MRTPNKPIDRLTLQDLNGFTIPLSFEVKGNLIIKGAV